MEAWLWQRATRGAMVEMGSNRREVENTHWRTGGSRRRWVSGTGIEACQSQKKSNRTYVSNLSVYLFNSLFFFFSLRSPSLLSSLPPGLDPLSGDSSQVWSSAPPHPASVPQPGFEPRSSAWRAMTLPLSHWHIHINPSFFWGHIFFNPGRFKSNTKEIPERTRIEPRLLQTQGHWITWTWMNLNEPIICTSWANGSFTWRSGWSLKPCKVQKTQKTWHGWEGLILLNRLCQFVSAWQLLMPLLHLVCVDAELKYFLSFSSLTEASGNTF